MRQNTQDRTLLRLRQILFALGCVCVAVGVVRQWPVFGGTYMQFIEGKGYLSLILGLVMIVLGFSVPLLFPGEEEKN